MPSVDARLKALEKKAKKAAEELKKVKKELAAQKKLNSDNKKKFALLNTWITKEAAWTKEVTDLLHMINLAAVAAAFPGTGGTNPPQTGPDWPGF